VQRREVCIPLARSLSRSVSLGTFRECHRSTNSVGTISYYDSRHSAMRIFTFLDLNGALVVTLYLVIKHHTQLTIFCGSGDKDLTLLF